MKTILKHALLIILFLFLSFIPAFAAESANIIANIEQEFLLDDIPEEVQLRVTERMPIDGKIILDNSVITADVIDVQKERRWHKSGFILLKVTNYEIPSGKSFSVEDKDIYFLARKYEKIDEKEAIIIGTEIVATQAASFVIPGIDIAYFFTKGAIKRNKNKNWFKSGVSNAYDNSICWFWLKGKPIELDEYDFVALEAIRKDKADKVKTQIEKRKLKELKRKEKRGNNEQRSE